jgi:hypothetical protein
VLVRTRSRALRPVDDAVYDVESMEERLQSACATRIPSATPRHANRVAWSASAAGLPSLSPGARRSSSGDSGVSAVTPACQRRRQQPKARTPRVRGLRRRRWSRRRRRGRRHGGSPRAVGRGRARRRLHTEEVHARPSSSWLYPFSRHRRWTIDWWQLNEEYRGID